MVKVNACVQKVEMPTTVGVQTDRCHWRSTRCHWRSSRCHWRSNRRHLRYGLWRKQSSPLRFAKLGSGNYTIFVCIDLTEETLSSSSLIEERWATTGKKA